MRLLSKNSKIIALVYSGDNINDDRQETFEIRIPIYVKDDKTKKDVLLRNLIFFSFDNKFIEFFCSELTQDGFKEKTPIWKTTNGEKLIYNPVNIAFEPVKE